MMVSLLMAISNINVKKHDKNRAQVKDMPYLAPETTMDVTLPVPTTYPTINNPGIMELINCLIFSIGVIASAYSLNNFC